MISATWADVRARRLERCGLTARFADVSDAARAVCGVHAQVQASADLQLAARVDGIARDDVRSALWEHRTVAKAWTLRGTLHVHAADDLPLWHAATRSGSRRAGLEEWRDPQGVLHARLSAPQVAAAQADVLEALGDAVLTRDELAESVRDPLARDRIRSGFAFLTGDLCQGPPRGAKTTLARPDRWLSGWREVPPAEARVEACRRFLRTYGPARPGDFREWLAGRTLAVGEIRELFAAVGVEEIDVEGRRTFVLAGDTSFPTLRGSIRLLPEYDVYVMASREREQLIPERVRDQLRRDRGSYDGPAGVRFLLVDGAAAGLWDRAVRGKRLELTVRPAVRLTKAHRSELEHEAERFAGFLGLQLALEIG